MILEGIVTTLSPEGTLNIAPMGPIVDASMRTLTLRPFATSHTCRNLRDHGEGVFHVTDDVLLLAKAAIGDVEPMPEVERANTILGYVLTDHCRHYEFRITSIDASTERVTMQAEVTHSGSRRDFVGFIRAKSLVLEAAILATRTAILPWTDIDAEYRKWEPIVAKTGGPAEIEAFALLRRHVDAARP
jgi:uncharacterized protein